MQVQQQHPSLYTLVPDEERINFYPKMIGSGDLLAVFESIVFHMAQLQIQEYSGGEWAFAISNNGTPFVWPAIKEDRVHFKNTFETEEVLPIEIAGILALRSALEYVLSKYNFSSDEFQDRLIDWHGNLLDLAYQFAAIYNCENEVFHLTD